MGDGGNLLDSLLQRVVLIPDISGYTIGIHSRPPALCRPLLACWGHQEKLCPTCMLYPSARQNAVSERSDNKKFSRYSTTRGPLFQNFLRLSASCCSYL